MMGPVVAQLAEKSGAVDVFVCCLLLIKADVSRDDGSNLPSRTQRNILTLCTLALLYIDIMSLLICPSTGHKQNKMKACTVQYRMPTK